MQGVMTGRFVLILVVILSCVACGPIWGLPESDFDLPGDSRLPRWFKIPGGYSRGDVSMRVIYYDVPLGGDDIRFDLNDRTGKILDQATGVGCRWDPLPARMKPNQYGGFNPGEGPRYVIVRVRATIEVLDHSVMGPVLRVVDDPSIVSGALDFVKAEHCF
jgi:hypothetical protein